MTDARPSGTRCGCNPGYPCNCDPSEKMTVENVEKAGALLKKWEVKPATAIYLLPHLALALSEAVAQEREAQEQHALDAGVIAGLRELVECKENILQPWKDDYFRMKDERDEARATVERLEKVVEVARKFLPTHRGDHEDCWCKDKTVELANAVAALDAPGKGEK